MADFFDNEANEPEVVNEPEQFEVAGTKYTQEELTRLVGLGQIATEAEEKYNTKIDKVWPEYGKTKNEVKEYERKVKELEEQVAKAQEAKANNGSGLESDLEVAQAKEAARKLGILLKDDLGELGFISKNDFRNEYARERAAERLVEKATGLEDKYDGKDGRPVFKTDDVLGYMSETGITDPEIAYKVKYEEKLNAWKESKINEAKGKSTMFTQKFGGGSKQPLDVRPTNDNLGQLISEALGGNE